MCKREREKRNEMCVSLLPLMVPALCTNEDLRATEYKNVLMLNKYRKEIVELGNKSGCTLKWLPVIQHVKHR